MDNEKIDMNVKKNNRPLLAHVCILMACVFWGLMSPLGKDAMMNGVDGICMARPTAAGLGGPLRIGV